MNGYRSQEVAYILWHSRDVTPEGNDELVTTFNAPETTSIWILPAAGVPVT